MLHDRNDFIVFPWLTDKSYLPKKSIRRLNQRNKYACLIVEILGGSPMNAAQQMHDDLVSTLLPLIPQTVYRDLRRLNTLAWAITGLCLTHTVRLGAWAQALPSPAQSAASRERRFSRWLHNRAISPNAWYPPVIQAALRNWPAQTRLYVALDTTALTPFVLIRASLVYRGRAIPLAWRSLSHRSTRGSVLRTTSPSSIRCVLLCHLA